MDAMHSSSYYESDQMDILKSSESESINYTYISHIVNAFEVLQSLRQYVVTSDILNGGRINIRIKCLF